MSIQVTADGFVHVGNNEFVSLEQIQQAVLRKQNPTLNTNCPHCQQNEESEIVDYRQELARIDAMPNPPIPTRTKQRKQVVNAQEEYLPLPSTLRINTEEKPTLNQTETEFLPLPSTARR